MPPSLKVDQVIDRTQTIRASVKDVEFTLLLTIALVVMVIFLFLRNVWATLIPSVTVPLALLGTAALMYVVGYSLDNLSLMALTIAVGFVVDDAIVMLENIYRHVEDGMTPMEAALKGAGEIGFTIISISVSLVAVFIPLLLMGGIVGRLFREFAVTVTLTIAVSVFVSLTLTPMHVRALPAATRSKAQHGRFYHDARARLRRHARAATSAAWTSCCAHQFATLMTLPRHGGATVVLFIVIPKGFFPQQDTGFIFGSARCAAGLVVRGDGDPRRCVLADVVRQDPDVAELGGVRRRRPPVQHRLLLHRASSRRTRRARERRPDHRAAAPEARGGARAHAVPAGRRRTSTSAAAWRARSTSTR